MTKECEKWQKKNEHKIYKFWDKKYPKFNLERIRAPKIIRTNQSSAGILKNVSTYCKRKCGTYPASK